MPPPVPRLTLRCEQCGDAYQRMACELRARPSRFCSKPCFYAAKRKGEPRTCTRCGASFYRKPSEGGTFCSRPCAKAARADGATSYPKIGERHAHRVIAERALGRPLLPSEIVHHRVVS